MTVLRCVSTGLVGRGGYQALLQGFYPLSGASRTCQCLHVIHCGQDHATHPCGWMMSLVCGYLRTLAAILLSIEGKEREMLFVHSHTRWAAYWPCPLGILLPIHGMGSTWLLLVAAVGQGKIGLSE